MLHKRVAALTCFALLFSFALVFIPGAALGLEEPGVASASTFLGDEASVTTWSEPKGWMDGSVSPSVPRAEVTNWQISSIAYYFGKMPPYEVGVNFTGKSWLCYITLRDEAGLENDTYEDLWAEYAGENKTYDVPGIYALPVALPSPFDVLDVVPKDKPLTLNVVVYDPTLPFFDYARKALDDEGVKAYYFIFIYKGPGLEPLTLWRSDDNGETWRISWKEGYADNEPTRVSWFPGVPISLEYGAADIRDGMMLAFEAEGRGGSHVVKIIDEEILDYELSGGDRDGGDRLPWSYFMKKPDAEPGVEAPPDPSVNEDKSNNTAASRRSSNAPLIITAATPEDLILVPSPPEEIESAAGHAPPAPGGAKSARGVNSSPPEQPPASPVDPPQNEAGAAAQGAVKNPADNPPEETAGEETVTALTEPNTPSERSGGAFPYAAVAGGVLGAGGAGGLAFRFRKRLAKLLKRLR